MSNDRKRNVHNRKPKKIILLAYEGANKTEKNYFDNFMTREGNFIIKTVPGNETDPENLVKQTIKKVKDLDLDLESDDKAYCIFDTDTKKRKNSQIDMAIKLAKSNNIGIITSSPCIELWFLLHFEYTTGYMTSDCAIERLKTHFPKYSKNCDIFSEIKSKTSLAYDRAKKLEKYQVSNGNDIKSVEANPHTEVYKVIDDFDINNSF